MSLFDKTTQALGSSLNMRSIKHNVTAANIANAETPGYKAQKVDFEESLARALRQESLPVGEFSSIEDHSLAQAAIERVGADVYDNPEGMVKNDGNTVDMEREMANLTENSILYKAALQLINKKMAAIRYAATEGSR